MSYLVPCAVGSYYDKDSLSCKHCAVGTYQSESGQLQCSVCPAIAGRQGVTIGPGARSASDCKGTTRHYILPIYFYLFILFADDIKYMFYYAINSGYLNIKGT